MERKKTKNPQDFKERFEFRLTVGDNIICQRYFRISQFNPLSLSSLELADTIRYCGETINDALKARTQVYLEITAPRIFNTVEEMETYFSKPENCKDMHIGEGIVVREQKVQNYFWGANGKPEPAKEPFDDGEFTEQLKAEDKPFYKFAFLVDGRETCAYGWEGVYPKFVRNSVDLANKNGKYEGEDTSRLSRDQYILYSMVKGKSDMIWDIIKEICDVCRLENRDYTTKENYGGKRYNFVPERR